MIITLAGRLIDDPSEKIHEIFPPGNSEVVQKELKSYFLAVHATTLICSGAAGADLLAMRAAGELKMDRFMILPYGKHKFMLDSVSIRPGNWTEIFIRIADDLEKNKHLIVLNGNPDDPMVYLKANNAILDFTEKLVLGSADAASLITADSAGLITAVIVWDGSKKGETDASFHFKENAEKRKFIIKEINTLHIT